MRLHIPVVAALAVLGAGWCAAADSGADNGQSVSTSADGKLAPQTFVDQAASAGMLEVKSSQLALSKGVGQKVRDFAQQMIDDHQKAGDELKQLAQKKGWTVKPDLAADDQKQLDKLQGYTGEDFSRQYVKMQAKAHDEAVSLFDRGSRDLQDADLKQFAQKYLPTLQHHQQMANDLKGQEKSSKVEGWRQGGAQSGTVGSDSWSSQSSAPGGANGSSSQGPIDSSQASGSSSGSLGSGDSTTIDSDIHGAANTPGLSGSQPNGALDNGAKAAPGGATDNAGYKPSTSDDSQQQSSVDTGVGGSSQNQGNMYRDDQPKGGSGY
jgi:putative membrane protein